MAVLNDLDIDFFNQLTPRISAIKYRCDHKLSQSARLIYCPKINHGGQKPGQVHSPEGLKMPKRSRKNLSRNAIFDRDVQTKYYR